MAKVLIVEDDFDVRESLHDWLAREHEVILASGVPEALALIDADEPDAVIADFELPPYFGDDFLALIAERWPQIGRILHTGSPGRHLGFAYSVAHRVLRKGDDLHELNAAIHEVVDACKGAWGAR
jgi:DNA-binding NtrC family response regulator